MSTWSPKCSRTSSATPEAVAREGRRWLSEPGYALHVLPRPARKAAGGLEGGINVSPQANEIFIDPDKGAFLPVLDITHKVTG